MSAGEPQELLDLARRLAAAAEAEILPRFHRHAVSYKRDGTEVTDADRAAEDAMREMLARECPAHAVLGEEQGGPTDLAADEALWVLDPIDGTASFTLGLPSFGVLVGFARRGEPLVGVTRFPALGEELYAARGAGCWFVSGTAAPRRARIARVPALAEAACAAGTLDGFDVWRESADAPAYRLSAILRRARKFRFVQDCMQHALVCRGALQVAIDPRMSPWDIAALVPCVEEAGGEVSSIDGRRDGILAAGSLLSTCGGALHADVVAALAP
jgi:histidinol-phosphatase